jgi:hypothetical protein
MHEATGGGLAIPPVCLWGKRPLPRLNRSIAEARRYARIRYSPLADTVWLLNSRRGVYEVGGSLLCSFA